MGQVSVTRVTSPSSPCGTYPISTCTTWIKVLQLKTLSISYGIFLALKITRAILANLPLSTNLTAFETIRVSLVFPRGSWKWWLHNGRDQISTFCTHEGEPQNWDYDCMFTILGCQYFSHLLLYVQGSFGDCGELTVSQQVFLVFLSAEL